MEIKTTGNKGRKVGRKEKGGRGGGGGKTIEEEGKGKR